MPNFEIPVNQVLRKKGQGLEQSKVNSQLIDSKALASNPTLKRVGITTMGCKVNAYESELISETLKSDNWSTVASTEVADLYIINTCTVTQEADRQARREVRKVIRKNPEALVVVTGCYAQMDSETCAKIPGVDLVLGNNQKLDFHELLPQLQNGELPKVLVGDLDEHVSLPTDLLTGYEAQTRAFIQIQQGCNQGCTFCIIHRARGPSRSLAPTLIKRQVERLVLNGYPEIVICGVDLGSYGEDFPNMEKSYNLVDLIKELLAIEVQDNPNFRIRLSSIDPVHITDDLIDLMASQARFCSHIHLSLQSGNTLILKRMKRRYTREDVYGKIGLLRKKVPDLVMSADVMVGFPTETEEQFDDTNQALIDLDIAFPHIFSYSDREGTPASRIPKEKQLESHVKKKRSNH
jgi:threonylcarbamoyladenosine tRNA methylthiotransferase MtaB